MADGTDRDEEGTRTQCTPVGILASDVQCFWREPYLGPLSFHAK